jgi:hypothetical protein
MDKILSLFESRRFWASIGSVLAVVFQEVLGLSGDQALVLVGILLCLSPVARITTSWPTKP